MKRGFKAILSAIALMAGFAACSPVVYYMAPMEDEQIQNSDLKTEISVLSADLLKEEK